MFVAYYDADKNYIRNSFGSRQGVTTADTWQECSYIFRPVNGEVYVKLKISLMEQPKNYPAGSIWVDNLYLGEGIGFEQAPSAKTAFNGSQTKVDALGNVEIMKNGSWTPFFPIGIYSDGTRSDWSIYSAQGFNTVMWVGDYVGVQKAKNAGMMSNFDLSDYIVAPNDNRYNNLTLLTSYINGIKNAGLMDSLLFYYCDNENAYDEWDVPISVTAKVRELDRDANNNLMHPIYFLQGNEGIARKYYSANVHISDIVGDYVTLDNPATYPEANRGSFGLITLDNIEQQTNPVVMAQINHGVGLRFRARVFSAIAHGAKGIGFWRDGGSAIPIEQQPWWNDLPNISSEINQLLPLIREPHWTNWTVTSSSDLIDFGTRDYDGEGYLIVANEQSYNINVTFTLSGLPYTAINARDFFTDSIAASISNNQFTVTIPAYGSKVYRLEAAPTNSGNTVLNLQLNEAGGSTASDSSGNGNDGTTVGDAYLSSGSLNLDGNGDYLDCGNDSSLEIGSSDFSITARVKLATTQMTYVGIATKGAASNTDAGYAFIYRGDTDELVFLLSNGTTRLWLDSNDSLGLKDNQWHRVTVTVSRNGDAIFYVDGTAVGSDNASALNGVNIVNANRNLLVGSWIGNWWLNGAVDEVKIYPQALTAQEVANL